MSAKGFQRIQIHTLSQVTGNACIASGEYKDAKDAARKGFPILKAVIPNLTEQIHLKIS